VKPIGANFITAKLTQWFSQVSLPALGPQCLAQII
jgi:hypothetical protein